MRLFYFLVILISTKAFAKEHHETPEFDTYSGNSLITYLYSHGIADTALQAHGVACVGAIGVPYITFDYPDSCLYNQKNHIKNSYDILAYLKRKIQSRWNLLVRGNYKESSLGQINDIQVLQKAYLKLFNKQERDTTGNKEKKVVIFGNSRGATTITPMIALYKPKNIAAVIAISPFDEMESILSHFKTRLKLDSLISVEKAQAIAEYIFQKYSRYGVRLIDLIKKIDCSIPTLIICSKEDALIPYQISVAVYSMLRNAGMKHIHLFITDHGAHGKILEGPDRKKCVSVIHAFYKKYHLPYNEELASLGDPLLL